MADSWEDLEPQPQAQAPAQRKAPNTGLNPNASSFSFNPSASTFTPSFAPKPAAPSAQSAQQPAAPSNAQSPRPHDSHYAATNGVAERKQEAQPMQVDPPSEKDTPVTSAAPPAEDVDQDMQEANGATASAGASQAQLPFLCSPQIPQKA